MNRTEFYETLEDIFSDIEAKTGNFQDKCGRDEKTINDAKFIATVALMVVDRYYTNLTKLKAERKEL